MSSQTVIYRLQGTNNGTGGSSSNNNYLRSFVQVCPHLTVVLKCTPRRKCHLDSIDVPLSHWLTEFFPSPQGDTDSISFIVRVPVSSDQPSTTRGRCFGDVWTFGAPKYSRLGHRALTLWSKHPYKSCVDVFLGALQQVPDADGQESRQDSAESGSPPSHLGGRQQTLGTGTGALISILLLVVPTSDPFRPPKGAQPSTFPGHSV